MTAEIDWLHRSDWSLGDLRALPDDGYRYEIMDGRLVVTPPPGALHQDVIEALKRIFESAWGDQSHLPKEEQYRAKVGVGVRMRRSGPERYVIPDLTVVRGVKRPEQYYEPDAVVAVVEVESPGSRLNDRGNKRTLYAEHGIASYYLVDTDAERVTGYGLAGGGYEVQWILDASHGAAGSWLEGHTFAELVAE